MGIFNIFTKKKKAKLEERYIPLPIERETIGEYAYFRKYERLVDEAIGILYSTHSFELGNTTLEIWEVKKFLLRECYGIIWETPLEKNPGSFVL